MLYQHCGWFIPGLIGAAMVGGAFPIWGLLLARTQDMFYLTNFDEMRRRSVVVAERFIMLGFNCLIGYTLQYYCIGQVGHRISTTLRSDMFEAIMRREIAFFDDERNAVGALTTRLADDCRTVHEGTGETFSNQLQALFTLAAGLIIGFTASWKITLVVIATFPINIVAGAMRMKERQGQKIGDDDGKTKKKKGNQPQEQNAEAGEGALISAAFTHMRTVSAFSIQHQVLYSQNFCNCSYLSRRVRQ
jgi:ATP-binding cassette subfamily B (MDR/TAP) protein 1